MIYFMATFTRKLIVKVQFCLFIAATIVDSTLTY